MGYAKGRLPLRELVEYLRALNRSRDIDSLGHVILRQAISLLPQAQAGSFLVLDETGKFFEYRAAVGWDLERLSRIKIPREAIIQRHMGGNAPMIIRNPRELNRRYLPKGIAEKLEQFPVASLISFPVVHRGEAVAYLNLDNREDPDAFSQKDIELLRPIAEEAAVAVRLERDRAWRKERDVVFRLVWDRLADALFITDFDGRILECNPAAERQTGYSREELLKMNIIRDLAVEEPAITYEKANERLARGETVVFEEKKRKKDGTFYWTECAVVQFEYKGRPATISVNRDITARKRLEERLRALEEASRRMKLATSKGELYELVLDSIHRILGYRACAILEPEGEALKVALERGYSPEARGLRIPLSGERGITVAAFTSGEPVYVPDVSKDPRYIPGAPGAKCEIALPISVGERKFGVLDVEHGEAGISPDDRELLGIMATELAVGLLSLERLGTLRSLSEKLAGLHRAVGRLQRCTTEEEVVQTAAQVAQDILGFETCVISLAEGEVLVPKAATGMAQGTARSFRKGEGVAGRTWEEGRTFWGNVEDFPEARPVHPSFKSFISVPIGDFGVFQVVATEPDAFARGDVQLAEILAGHLREEIQRVRLEAELREQAIRDPLTGLYNRRFLDEVLERELSRAARYRHPIALIIADIDGFKELNDRYGHLVGDEALRRVARALREGIRRADYIFRWGGDEFVIVLPETGEEGAREVVRRFREPFGPLAEEPQVRLSMGYAVWDPAEGPLPAVEDLFRRADALLYEMKAA